MYFNCQFEIEDALVVITEIEYTPKQSKTHYQEEILAHVTIESGYAIGFNGEDMDFDYFLKEYDFYLHDEVMKKFLEDRG